MLAPALESPNDRSHPGAAPRGQGSQCRGATNAGAGRLLDPIAGRAELRERPANELDVLLRHRLLRQPGGFEGLGAGRGCRVGQTQPERNRAGNGHPPRRSRRHRCRTIPRVLSRPARAARVRAETIQYPDVSGNRGGRVPEGPGRQRMAFGLRPADGGEHRYYEVGLEHVAVEVERRDEVDEAYARCLSSGSDISTSRPRDDRDEPAGTTRSSLRSGRGFESK